MYGCQSWSLHLRVERELAVSLWDLGCASLDEMRISYLGKF